MQGTAIQLEVNAMSDETLRSRNNMAIWAVVAITLLPLLPYALGGTAG
jgi:hypothetical protein